VDDLGVSRNDLHTVAYWIAGEASEEDLDVTDPAVLQSLEFS
jgi:hypothetical protein